MDYANLQIAVTTKGIKSANRDLDGLSAKGGKAERASDKLRFSYAKLAGAAAAFAGAAALANKALDASSKYEKLNNQLITATGSLAGAALEFKSLQQFASTTPFVLEEVVGSFIKLTNLGLNPSQEALISYGNTASAMGKSLDQLIEAVADATVGEFERLKEFGIKARSEGDNVSFTFRGVTTTVRKNAQEIQDYLREIGDVQFAGAMERQSDSLETAFSNLGAATEGLISHISSESGLDTAAKSAAVALTELFNSLAGAPGEVSEVEKLIQSTTERLDNLAKAGATSQHLSRVSSQIRSLNLELAEALSVTNDADNLERARGILREHLAYLSESVAEARDKLAEDPDSTGLAITFKGVSRLYQKTAQELIAVTEKLRKTQEEGASAPPPIKTPALDKLEESLNRQIALYDDRSASAKASYQLEQALLTETDEAKRRSIQEQIDQLKELEQAKKDLKSAEDQAADEARVTASFDRLAQSLLTEEEAIQDSYQRRLEIITEYENQTGIAQTEARIRLAQERDEQLLEINGSFWERYLLAAEEQLTNFDDLALSTIENFSTGVGDALADALLNAEDFGEGFRNVMRSVAASTISAISKMIVEFLILKAVKAALGKDDEKSEEDKARKEAAGKMASAKALQNASTVAEAGLNAFAATAAIPVVGPAAAPAAAIAATTGAAIYATAATALSAASAGAYDLGGMIPAGKTGIVGEYGPELIQGPANITSRRATADRGGKAGGDVNVTVEINQQPGSPEIDVSTQRQPDGSVRVVLTEMVKQIVNQDLATGGAISSGISNNFGLPRRGR